LHGTQAVGVGQTLLRDSITELSLLIIFAPESESPLTEFRQLQKFTANGKTKTHAFDYVSF